MIANRANQLLLLVGLMLLHSGLAAAQQTVPTTSADTLPAVSYPFPVPGSTGPAVGTPPIAPLPGQYADSSSPVQYEMVGGVWGFWDRGRRFHRAPVSLVDGRPFNVVTPSAAAAVPVAPAPHAIMRRPPVPMSVVRLPNAFPGRIVARGVMPRGRSPVR